MMELPQPSGEPVGKMILRYFSYMVIMMLTFSGIRVYDKVCGSQVANARQTKGAASQTQTTYTEVAGAARPRFKVLSEHSHG
jgi:hypothetical protein